MSIEAMTTPIPLSEEELALVKERLLNGTYDKLSPATGLRLLATIDQLARGEGWRERLQALSDAVRSFDAILGAAYPDETLEETEQRGYQQLMAALNKHGLPQIPKQAPPKPQDPT